MIFRRESPCRDPRRESWLEGRDRFAYSLQNGSVIANMEQMARDFLNSGGKTGFVGGSDTHEGRPAARTAVLAKELTREAIFDALRHRRNYGVWSARTAVGF